MKKKEIKEMAKKIVKYETIIQNSTNEAEIMRAQDAILGLSKSVHSFNDMITIDEMVQDMMSQ